MADENQEPEAMRHFVVGPDGTERQVNASEFLEAMRFGSDPEPEWGKSRKAVVSYPMGASNTEKITALQDGMINCATELLELGVSFDEVENACNRAIDVAADEFESGKSASEES